MDFELTEELRILQQASRESAPKELAPVAIERDDGNEYPTDIMKKLGPLGFLDMMVPEECGARPPERCATRRVSCCGLSCVRPRG